MTEINLTSNATWNAMLYLMGPTGYQLSIGYSISPSTQVNVPILNLNTIGMKRAWISFLSVGVLRYIRILIISKILQAVLFLSPFIISDLVFSALKFKWADTALLIFLFVYPLYQCIFITLYSATRKHQIVDEYFLPEPVSATGVLVLMVLISLLMIVASLVILPFLILIYIPALTVVCFIILSSKRFWIKRIVERGL